MQSTAVFNIASLGWLSVQAVPLLLWPQFVASLLATDRLISPVSIYFARALGLGQLGLALQGLVLSGLLPLGPAASATSGDDDDNDNAGAPYAWAAVLIATLYHGAAAFYSYGCYYDYDEPQTASVTAYAFGCLGSSSLAALGLWCLMFGDGSGHRRHISKRTGADKRTSGFPFKNSAADKRKGKGKEQ